MIEDDGCDTRSGCANVATTCDEWDLLYSVRRLDDCHRAGYVRITKDQVCALINRCAY